MFHPQNELSSSQMLYPNNPLCQHLYIFVLCWCTHWNILDDVFLLKWYRSFWDLVVAFWQWNVYIIVELAACCICWDSFVCGKLCSDGVYSGFAFPSPQFDFTLFFSRCESGFLCHFTSTCDHTKSRDFTTAHIEMRILFHYNNSIITKYPLCVCVCFQLHGIETTKGLFNTNTVFFNFYLRFRINFDLFIFGRFTFSLSLLYSAYEISCIMIHHK